MENTNNNEIVKDFTPASVSIPETGGKKNKTLIIVIAIIVIAIGGYLVFGKGILSKAESVATVNGISILKKNYDLQFANALATYKAQGLDLEKDTAKLADVKKQVLDNLINSEVLLQAAKASGIKPDSAEEEKQFQNILTQIGGADKLKEELAKNNITEVEVKDDIKKQVIIQAYLLQNIDVKSIVVTDAEISAAYEQFVKIQKDSGQKTIPALKELSSEIKQYLITTKQQSLIMNFVNTLKAKADIKTTI